MKTILFSILLVVLFSAQGHAQFYTVNNGNWNDPNTWNGGNVPISNNYTGAYDSLFIDHAIRYDNGGVPGRCFVNHLFRISANGSLTIDPHDSLFTGEGTGGIPILINDGLIKCESSSWFATFISSAAYAQVYSKHETVVEDSAFLRFLSYDYSLLDGDVQVGNSAFLDLQSVNGDAKNTASVTVEAEGTFFIIGSNSVNGSQVLLDGDSAMVMMQSFDSGVTLNQGPIVGNNSASLVSLQADHAIVNTGPITGHRVFTTSVFQSSADTVFHNSSNINTATCSIAGDQYGVWNNDGTILADSIFTIFESRFVGTGNLCSRLAFTTLDADFSGSLDLCCLGPVGIIHNNSTIGPNVSSCQTPCSISTSISDNSVGSLVLYPNPTRSDVFVDSPYPLEKIAVYDVNGQKVVEKTGQTGKSIHLGNLTPGLYLYRIEDVQGNRFVGRIVLERHL